MPAVKDNSKKLKKELETAKKAIAALKKDQEQCMKDINLLIEEAYLTGYADSIQDFDKKTEAMDKYLQDAMVKFEKEYEKKLCGTKTKKVKKTAAKPRKVKKVKKTKKAKK